MISTLFDAAYYSGTSQSTQVPGLFDVSLNGRPYMVDTKYADQFRRQPIELLRRQADQSPTFGEQTLSPEDAVRRSQDSWHRGAGQTNLDREDSDPARFRSSKGVDVWEKWALSLLPDTDVKRSSVSATCLLAVAGDYLYHCDGSSLAYTASLTGTPSWTTLTGWSGTATSLCSDGYRVYTAHGAAGVFSSIRGTASTASYNTLPASTVAYTRGRLMAAYGSSVYNITSTTPPTALFTHPNVDFSWVGFAEGQSVIYAAGFSGDKSLIYRIGIKSDGTGLDVPIVAGQLPDGEVVRSIGAYLNFVVLGSDRGVRFCSSNSDGSLTIGTLIRTDEPVLCFEGQDRFVWFGWSNYDTASTGLGRLDLSTFINTLTPAYASDLMVDGQGTVRSVVTFDERLVLGVAGLGVYAQSDNKVEAGTLESGKIAYGISDSKIALFVDVRVRDNLGAHKAYVAADSGAFALVGQSQGATSFDSAYPVGQVPGESFEVRVELERDITPTVGATLTRYTLRAYPRPRRGQTFTVPLLLHERVLNRAKAEHYQDPLAELDALLALQDSRALIVFQSGAQSYTCLVDETVFMHAHRTNDGRGWNGSLIVRLKALAI